MTNYNYTDYEQIPYEIVGYIMSVADADNIAEVSLEDINEFLNELEHAFDRTGWWL